MDNAQKAGVLEGWGVHAIQDTKSPGRRNSHCRVGAGSGAKTNAPVTELCASDSREFLWCFVCFRDFFKNKQTKR